MSTPFATDLHALSGVDLARAFMRARETDPVAYLADSLISVNRSRPGFLVLDRSAWDDDHLDMILSTCDVPGSPVPASRNAIAPYLDPALTLARHVWTEHALRFKGRGPVIPDLVQREQVARYRLPMLLSDKLRRAKVMNARPDMSDAEKRVAVHILIQVHHCGTGWCYPSDQDIANELVIGLRTVERAMNRLTGDLALFDAVRFDTRNRRKKLTTRRRQLRPRLDNWPLPPAAATAFPKPAIAPLPAPVTVADGGTTPHEWYRHVGGTTPPSGTAICGGTTLHETTDFPEKNAICSNVLREHNGGTTLHATEKGSSFHSEGYTENPVGYSEHASACLAGEGFETQKEGSAGREEASTGDQEKVAGLSLDERMQIIGQWRTRYPSGLNGLPVPGLDDVPGIVAFAQALKARKKNITNITAGLIPWPSARRDSPAIPDSQ